jgi:hypothetical protein
MEIKIEINTDEDKSPKVDIKKKKKKGGIIELPAAQDQMNRAPGNNSNGILDFLGV